MHRFGLLVRRGRWEALARIRVNPVGNALHDLYGAVGFHWEDRSINGGHSHRLLPFVGSKLLEAKEVFLTRLQILKSPFKGRILFH
ncbi:MAG: hypothetical protein PHG55_09485, partial [Verrucomicrobiota bacterium]|nr:hypothetical protein [Verrucomicrobiota bacterium]